MSTLCDDILLERLNEPGIYHYETKELHYFSLWGTQQCREAIANCLTRIFSPDRPLHPDNVSFISAYSRGGQPAALDKYTQIPF